MKIKLFNTLSRSIEDFKPIDENEVSIYSCGPTVYNFAHIGNMRAFLFADLLQRILKVVGEYNVKWVMNITDIDDKTIRDCKPEAGAWPKDLEKASGDLVADLRSFTTYYMEKFKEDISRLGIQLDDIYSLPRATDYINEMQNLIRKIYDNGYAYEVDGNVYFNVGKWSATGNYGKLKNIDWDNFKSGQRIDSDEYEREQVSDFVLWKSKKEGEPSWDFELDGKTIQGRPGWHLECSTMEKEIFGLPFDIHTGGVDLQFPHHEDEIAQSHAGYGIEPTHYWCHNEFLEVEGTKMSKSAGNFFILKDLEDKGIDSLDVRFLMQSQHYRTKFNFTIEGLKASSKARKRVQDFIYSIFENDGNEIADIDVLREKIMNHLANDLHTPKALAEVFTFINKNKTKHFNKSSKDKLICLFKELNGIFAVWDINRKQSDGLDIPEEIKTLAQKRFEAKNNKDWDLADQLRNQIKELGFIIKDTKNNYEIIKND